MKSDTSNVRAGHEHYWSAWKLVTHLFGVRTIQRRCLVCGAEQRKSERYPE